MVLDSHVVVVPTSDWGVIAVDCCGCAYICETRKCILVENIEILKA